MSDQWYYAQEEKPVGPISLEQLRTMLKSYPDWRQVLVWRPGAKDWEEAGAVAELAVAPPPLPKKEKATAILSTSSQQRSKWIIVLALLFVILPAVALSGGIGREVARALISWWRAAPVDGPWNDYRSKGSLLTDEQVFGSPPSQRFLESSLYQALQKGVEETKRRLPYQADAATTLVDVSLTGTAVTYIYIVDETKVSITSTFARDMRKRLATRMCEPTMLRSMKVGAGYWFVYRDKKGRTLAMFDLTEGACASR